MRWTTDGGDTWTQATMPPSLETQVPLNGLFITEDEEDQITGWAVGHGGVILRTRDDSDGKIWDDFNEDARLTNKVGEGNPCTPTGQLAVLYDIFWIDEDIGWVVGEDGALCRTVNGGVSWSDGSTSPTFTPPSQFGCQEDPYDAYRIHFFEDSGTGYDPYDKGLIASEFGKVFYTTDGGDTWTTATVLGGTSNDVCPEVEGNLEFWGLDFEDPTDATSHGWLTGGVVTGSGYIFEFDAEDVFGGTEPYPWTQSHCFDLISPSSTINIEEEPCNIRTAYDVAILGASDPKAITVGYSGEMFVREAGTADFDPCDCANEPATGCSANDPTWVQRNTSFSSAFCSDRGAFFGVAKLTSDTAFAVGAFGRMTHYDDNSGSPVLTESGSTHDARLYGGSFITSSIGFAVGQGYAIKRTTDGGATWTDVDDWECAGQEQFNAIAFSDSGVYGVAVGTNGLIAYSSNAGVSWDEYDWGFTNRTDFYDVAFVPGEPDVFAVGAGGTVVTSTNSGQSWSAVANAGTAALYGVAFADPDLGYVCGADKKVYRTTGGGASWAAVTVNGGESVTLRAIDTWDDGSEAIAVGDNGTVFEKSGSTFELVEDTSFTDLAVTAHLHDVQAIENGSDIDLRICGDNGTVLLRDADDWSQPKSHTNNPLWALSFVALDQGWAFGQNFVVLAYSD